MSLALCTTSHTPLMGRAEPAPEVVDRVESAFDRARAFIRDYGPELVVIFGPDHYNGFFYDVMPPFCIGAAAESVGDYGLPTGPLPVDAEAARAIAREVLASGIDVAVSERMQVDHGFGQPLELLFGAIDAVPLVPVFINCVAEPLGPVSRIRLLGEAVGRGAAATGRRVLVVGSGGLSHDPPVPRLDGAPPPVAERLIAGRNPTPSERAVREARVIDAIAGFAAGTSDLMPLNPQWDTEVMGVLAAGDLERVDDWAVDWFVENGGHSAHEVRTWIAAYAALAAGGRYQVETSFYEAIPEWIAGFGLTTARTVPA
ncbi:3-carboxyethylcatechol 2,3-dioxygenase [Pseudonocardia acidicola]|uniref:2,3-dihydroxyphenylpropionate/2,3-dihydroxicinnamic acid 1,2-dioxygenase n=1 Tax=Pseudonocardia acidicola TaxID=2724939 RepID=A0ABX1SF62_9PSEU|nr:3-carboxyethylcatechol 2,3-dioxygenase [Pseudonocardia acidicola]NMH99542.1 3-carboxyethylcatechol 2,3-dioxygenase [Pseudonocardia acidicola]